MANVGPNAWYCRDNSPGGAAGTGTVGWSAVTAWHTSWTPAAGQITRQGNSLPAVAAERCFVCTTSGAVTNPGPPTWVLTKGASTTDTSAVWRECTGQPGVNGDHFSATTVATNGTTAAGSAVLNFASVPANVSIGQIVINKSATTVIPAGSKVVAFSATTVTISAVTTGAGVGNGATIAFSFCPTWGMQASQTVTIGLVISNNAGTFLFICTTAGTCGAAEPTFTLTAGVTTTDNASTVWTCIGANAGFTAWGAPFARLTPTIASTWAANGDVVFVGDDHSETQGAAMAITGGTTPLPLKVLSIDHTVAMPGGTLKSGAAVTTTTTFAITIAGGAAAAGMYFNGITFSSGSGANATVLNITTSQTFGVLILAVFENCALRKLGTSSANPAIIFGSNLGQNKTRLINTTMQFGNTADRLRMIGVDFLWKSTASAITGGTVPASLFYSTSFNDANVTATCNGVDLSAITGTIATTIPGSYNKMLFMDCKTNSSATLGVTPAQPEGTIDFIRCSSAAHDYDFTSYRYEGTLTANTVVVRTGGASDGTTTISYAVTTTANAQWVNPMECLPITMWNSVISPTDVTVTLYGVANTVAMPDNDDAWFDIEYLGSSATPLASFDTTTKINFLGGGVASTADSTSVWSSGATTRADGETVAVGAIRKTTDNTSRIFFCTAITTGVLGTGTSFAAVIDGGTIVDGGATFRAGWRFSQAVVLSPKVGMVGYLRVVPKVALASSTIYFDPQPVLS